MLSNNDNYKCKICHINCKECYGPNENNCLICKEEKYLYLGKCVSNCLRDYYNNRDNNQKMCKCEILNCYSCNAESFNKGLCIECEEEYYPVYDDDRNNNSQFQNCSQLFFGYYLENTKIYKKCYESCNKCDTAGNNTMHNCKECKHEYNFEIDYGITKNCYTNCTYFHYFNEAKSTSFCTTSFNCPINYDKLIYVKKECVSNCTKDRKYKYEFRKRCYEDCPLSNSTKRVNITKLNGIIYDEYFCKPICDQESPFEVIHTQECYKNCPVKYLLDKSCILNYLSPEKNNQEKEKETKTEEEKKEEKIKANDIFIKNIEVDFTSNEYETTNLDNGINEEINFNDMKILLTTTLIQKKDKNNSEIIIIDLGECENILRDKYKIPDNKLLYMKKIAVKQEGMKIPKIEYDVYSKLNGTKLVKLNLTYCENTKIDISIPIVLNENIDILNSSSGYYNDLCYITSSNDGTDIILNDRKKEFLDNNKTVCQENCIFSEYIYDIKKVKCTCDIKESSNSFANINIDKQKLYDNFINIKNIANIGILSCYKVLFSIKGIKKNIGNYILLLFIIIHFILLILFYTKNFFNIFFKKVKNITFGLKNWKLVLAEKREKKRIKKETKLIENKKLENVNKEIISNTQKIDKSKNVITNEQKIISPLNILHNDFDTKNYIENNNNKNSMYSSGSEKAPNQLIKIDKKGNNEILNLNWGDIIDKKQNIITQNTKTRERLNFSAINEKKLEKIKKIMAYNDDELNNLSYKLAKKYDKRNISQYFFSLLRTKHIILFTFFNNNDYNIKIIKIDLFLFGFILYFVVNALFFNDDTMHKIYKDKGDYNFIYQFPQIIYSFLISLVFNILLKLLALSEKTILKYKKHKKQDNLNEKEKLIKNKLKFKFLIYFIIITLFLILFWYYLSMFCSIYINTQLHLIKDTLISYALSLLYPLGIYIIPGICRIPALSGKKKKRRYILFKISKILQMI